MSAPRGRKSQAASRTNAEWSEATTVELRARARREFARAGYAAASVDAIVEAAGLTKGAVYYHYGSKQGLFEAVLRDVQADIVRRIDARAEASSDTVEAVVDGCLAFLDIAVDDEVRQIALVDGPAVLGWAKWRALDGEFGLGSLKEGLRACQRSDAEVLAHLISGALNEAVFMVAEAKDRKGTAARLAIAVRRFIRALLG